MGTDNARGKAKEAVGRATDDESLERQGKQDQAKGSAKDAGRKAKDAARKAKDALTND
ncbi:CsbD family protein [Salsipaludibacter albus]|uniref:CsbD family protein n=1 Tax=Salsipaludibacter albus TaxID=2849650 RepID=UPI001EE4E8A7|nr:CsbD family protein [Salsipaludibacter albus]MBY5162480.1 CsbD family protein [Salsipaludibacter albus]